MKKQLKSILLIDDSKADIFLMSRVIKKSAVTKKVITVYGAQEALDYLSGSVDGEYPSPSLIFLDINMPNMSGWDFLDKYKLLPEPMKADIVVCMITTSGAKEDLDKAAKYDILREFTNKPLTHEKLMSIIGEYFPDFI